MNEASKNIDEYLLKVPEWQNIRLREFRKLVHEVEPLIEEQWKWKTAVFALGGKMLFSMGGFKNHTKYVFMTGASLKDPAHLINAGFEAKDMRAIDLKESDEIDKNKLRALIKEAIDAVKG